MVEELERKLKLPGVETGAYEVPCQCSADGTVAQWQSTGMVSHRHRVELRKLHLSFLLLRHFKKIHRL